MPQASQSTSTAHQPAIATHDNTTPPHIDWVVGSTLEQARAAAEELGIPQPRAVTVTDALKVVDNGQTIATVRAAHDDRAEPWGELEERATKQPGHQT